MVARRGWKRAVRRSVLRGVAGFYASLVVRGKLWDGRSVPLSAGRYGPADGECLSLVVLGDSSALAVGVLKHDETNGVRLARDVVASLGCAVELEVLARSGVTTAGMARQVDAVVTRADRGVALILIGGNDVMLPSPVGRSARRLGRYVRRLRAAGWEVVIGSCADIGAAPSLRRGVRDVASRRSQALARRQAARSLAAGAMVVSLTTDVFRQQPDLLYCPDGFHPNADGYLYYETRAAVAVKAASARVLGRLESPAERADMVFSQTRQAARRVTREPGASFIPAPAGEAVAMHRYAPRQRSAVGDSSAMVSTAS
ncbi:SGNH/GDSL hydrolase family protein [Streptomyces flavidovirens]|uniref:SGNH/GDSL hydrolase family protein n=1 Tax=Streptomyces flavidovirens TaxID=67298 RepID=UPI0009987A6F|nr:SGNH/GDSL hydrolase family protein [Streptomyces flavidovirens]